MMFLHITSPSSILNILSILYHLLQSVVTQKRASNFVFQVNCSKYLEIYSRMALPQLPLHSFRPDRCFSNLHIAKDMCFISTRLKYEKAGLYLQCTQKMSAKSMPWQKGNEKDDPIFTARCCHLSVFTFVANLYHSHSVTDSFKK
jgi:hypothetical protein